MSYELFIIGDNGKPASWSHTSIERQKGSLPCLHFPDDRDIVIVIQHPTRTTHIYISADGELDIETVD